MRVLVVSVLFLLTGCAAEEPDPVDTPTPAGPQIIVQDSDDLILTDGDYFESTFELDGGGALLTSTWETDGGYVDVFVLTAVNKQQFLAGNDFVAVCSDESTTGGSLNCNISNAGEHSFVIDNSPAGQSSSGQQVRVQYSYQVEA